MPQSSDAFKGAPIEFRSLDHMNNSFYEQAPSLETQQRVTTNIPRLEENAQRLGDGPSDRDHNRFLGAPQRYQQPINPPNDAKNCMHPAVDNAPYLNREGSRRASAVVAEQRNARILENEMNEPLTDSIEIQSQSLSDDEASLEGSAPEHEPGYYLPKIVPLVKKKDLRSGPTLKWMRDIPSSVLHHYLTFIYDDQSWDLSLCEKKSWVRWQPMTDDLGLELGDVVTLSPVENANGIVTAVRVYIKKKSPEMDEPLTDVIETQSEDEASHENPPRGAQRPRASRLGRITAGLRSQKYILKENNDPRKADESLKRVHAVVWMKNSTRKNHTPGLLKCKLMTPGLLVPVGFEWTLPLKGKMTYLTVEQMVNDLQLKFHDEILFEETMDDNGRIYACVYVTKHRADVDTPLAQGIAPAPLVDTEGANTSAAHAAAVAAPAAPLSGTGRAATKRNFHRMEDSQGPQTDNRRTQRRQIETDAALVEDPLPSPSAATPVAAPTDPVPDAGASTQVPALFTLFLQMDEFLKRQVSLHQLSVTSRTFSSPSQNKVNVSTTR